MKIAGIIAEYNPFHNGHAYQIETLRKNGYDAVICVCSPGVVQRGDCALFPTSVRTNAALLGGADLVISLPAPYAALSAEGFAFAAVYILCAIGVCDVICFGAEDADTQRLIAVAKALQSEEFKQKLQGKLQGGTPFAAVRAAAADKVLPGAGDILRTPNNILGVEYCRALLSYSRGLAPELLVHKKNVFANKFYVPTSNLSTPNLSACATNLQEKAEFKNGFKFPQPLAIARKGVNHDEPLRAYQDVFASASALREQFFTGGGHEGIYSYVPQQCVPVYRQAVQCGHFLSRRSFDIAVLSRLREMDEHNLVAIRGMTEGLEHRLLKAVQKSATVAQLCDTLKTKRYAHARLRRLVMDAALKFNNFLPSRPPYVHALGASKKGLAVLKSIKKQSVVPVSHSLAQLKLCGMSAFTVADAHSKAEDFAALCLNKPMECGSAFTQKFITTK